MSASNKNLILVLVFVVALAGAGFFFFVSKNKEQAVSIQNTIREESKIQTYSNTEYGVSFVYPKNYYLEEKQEGERGRTHLAIILTEDTEENRLVREGKSPGRDGPMAITFDIYRDTIDNPSLIEWLKETPGSNFSLSNGTFQNTTVSGKPAVSYRWSGLYEADTVATQNRDYIFAGSVMYITKGDAIRGVFDSIIKTVKLK